MPRFRARLKGRPHRTGRRRHWVRDMFRLVASWRAIGLFILVLAVLGLVWFSPLLASAFISLWESLLRTFGLGLGVLLLALATLGLAIWRRRLFSLIRRWDRWLEAMALGLLALGILAFFSPRSGMLTDATLGGSLGKAVIGRPDLWGLLRLVVLALVCVALLVPSRTLVLFSSLLKWLLRSFRNYFIPRLIAGVRILVRPKRKPAREVPSGSTEQEYEAVPSAAAQVVPPSEAPVASAIAQSESEAAETVPVSPFPNGRWQLPPIDILDKATELEFSQADNEERAHLIEEALASYGVEAKVVQINPGPAVTQFGVEPGWDHKYREVKERDQDGRIKLDKDGRPKVRLEEVSRTRVKVERINSLANDLALALAAPSIRIEAPVPGKPVVGIEVPNVVTGTVTVRGVIESTAFQRLKAKSKLALALGKSVAGEAVVGDLSKMPHLLIAGATGSGKSVCINSIIACLLMHTTPDEVRLLMIDPKRVELTSFNSVPHLLMPVVVEIDKVVAVLRWVTQEMDSRYRRLAAVAARNIDAYNKSPRVVEPMPYLVLIIDELADLMMVAPYEVERTICRLAQLARATGIHLIIATQRPSVDVVTGLIKANFPTRISFAVTSQVDSRTILDLGGAEKLLGRGDMLYMPTDAAKPKRLQGSFVSDQEIERLVNFWNDERWRELRPIQLAEDFASLESLVGGESSATDPMLEKAKQLASEHTRISTSLLQRRLRIGYPRAARLIDQLEEEGIISPGDSGKSRQVLVGIGEEEETK